MSTEDAAGADGDGIAVEYQFWVEHSAVERLAAGMRKLLPGDGTVLDAGCGAGSLSVALSPYCRQVVAIDLSAEMLGLARHKIQVAGLGNIQLVQCDLRQLTVTECKFDLVISRFALHHTPVASSLPMLAQAVKPGGWLVMQEPTCPVRGAFRPLWYRWQGLRSAGTALGQHGARTAWRIGRFQQSRVWIQHQLADAHWDAQEWRTAVELALPGAVLQLSADQASVTVLWQRPAVEEAAGRAEAIPDAHQTHGNLRTDRVLVEAPVQVGKYYPRPAPDAYVPFPRSAIEGSVVARFEAQVAVYEGREAVRTRNLELTYGQLNAAANRIAHRLLSWVPAGSARVSILMDQDDPVIPAIFGVLKAGLTYVALDPADDPKRQARIVAQASSEILLTTAARSAEFGSIANQVGNRLRLLVLEDLDGAQETNPGLPLGPDHLAAIFFTSGSTGEPKGVARDHRQFLHSTWLNTNTYYVAPTDRQSLLYFPGFTASVPNIYDTLLNGATLCCVNPRGMVPSTLLDWLRRERITHFNPPIGLWRSLLDAVPENTRWPDLRLVTLAGQSIYSRDVHNFQARFGADSVLLHVLAMTEAGAITQGYIDATTAAANGPVPAGYAVADKVIAIVDDAGAPLPAGETGRIAVSSAYLSLGYWPDALSSGTGFQRTAGDTNWRTYLTGDRGRFREDGCLEHFGRADTVVKVRGYRVEIAAVESELHTLPYVSEAAVITVERDGGETGLVAYMVCSETRRPETEAVCVHLARLLPHYMIPERFVWLDAMPLTASGKPDRQRLPLPSTTRPALSTPYVEPRTELERQLTSFWVDILEVGQIGVDDNLFDLGSDSITTIRLIAKIERIYGCRVPTTFFSTPTIANLARIVAGGSQEDESGSERPARVLAAPSVEVGTRARFETLLNHTMQRGPLWHGRALPYAAGVRLQRRWIHAPLLASELARRSTVLQPWLASIESASLRREIMELSLLANTWTRWRTHCVQEPATLERWIDVGGVDILDAVLRTSHPILLVGVHTAVYNIAAVEVVRRRSQRAAWTLGYSPNGILDSAPKLIMAHERLRAGGIVFIAADGADGTRGVDIPLGGKRWLFRTGAAELALLTGATMLPVFTTLRRSGRIQVLFKEPLIMTAEGRQRQAHELTEQYAALLNEHWTLLLGSMKWKKLHQIIEYSKQQF